jgi:phosphoglycolate phosphatase
MMQREFDLLVFDWDGTLIDSTATIALCIQAACRDVGLPIPSMQAASHVIGLGLSDALAHVAPTATHDEVRALAQRYRVHWLLHDEHLVLFDGVTDMLADLGGAGYRLAVATGKTRNGLDRAMELVGVTRHFEASRCADETAGKPDPLMLHELMDECDVPPERVLMIGDTTHDLLMARNAGVAAAAVTRGAHPREQLISLAPLACVPTVVDLREWLGLS